MLCYLELFKQDWIEQNLVGLLDQELTEHTAAGRQHKAELLFGGETPQQNQNALEIWTLAAKFAIKVEVLHKLFNVISVGTACSQIQLQV